MPPTETTSRAPTPALTAVLPTSTAVPPTSTPTPQVGFVVEIVAFEDGSLDASRLCSIYFTLLTASRAPIDGIVLEEVNSLPATHVVSGDKGPGKAELTLWAADYPFEVVGNTSGQPLSSEVTHILSILYGHAVSDDLIRAASAPTRRRAKPWALSTSATTSPSNGRSRPWAQN